MTNEERITALEARLGQAEGRVALLEARPLPLLPSIQALPAGGYTCSVCHHWVPNGMFHSCGGFPAWGNVS